MRVAVASGPTAVRAKSASVRWQAIDDIFVFPRPPLPEGVPYSGVSAPPISSDPPMHQWARKLILPFFAPGAVRPYEAGTRELCHGLIDEFVGWVRAILEQGHSDE